MFDVVTSHPVALKSLDHLFPCGTINDNSGQPDFIRKMVDLGVTSLLDIGCAGGLLVTQANDAGIRAVGIEGSDASQKAGRAEWGNVAAALPLHRRRRQALFDPLERPTLPIRCSDRLGSPGAYRAGRLIPTLRQHQPAYPGWQRSVLLHHLYALAVVWR
jgi:hypothetical protein